MGSDRTAGKNRRVLRLLDEFERRLAAERAVNCAQLSILEDARQRVVPLDKVIDVMYRTGIDLQATYKETSLGGLAKAIGDAWQKA